jgi:SAM-dependent methyltransferase
VPDDISMADSYDLFPGIEVAFQRRLDQSLDPRGPESLWELFGALDPGPGTVVVDVGCGEGEDAVELARRFATTVVGVDPVPRHIELGRGLADEAGVGGQVTFALGAAEQVPLDDSSADLVWAKESLMYADLEVALQEFRRVLRPGGAGFVYQVFTGPSMTDAEAAEFWRLGPAASSVRPEAFERAVERAGLSLIERVDFGSEWGEVAQETSGEPGRRLLHLARLLRAPARFIDEFGETSYRIMLGDCLWHVYRMIGKLHGAAFTFRAPE